MKYGKSLLLSAFLLGGAASSFATWYTSESAFLAAIQANFYDEDFSNFIYGDPLNGTQLMWDAPGANGFGWQASAAGGLWSNESALSTNTAFDPITITFMGNPVTAFGGYFTNTDISGNNIPGLVDVTVSNGDMQTLTDPTPTTFLGYTSTTAFASVTVGVQTNPTNGWPQIDHFITAAAVPEPATVTALALGVVALARRRRK